MDARVNIPTREGIFLATFSSHGLRQLCFPKPEAEPPAESVDDRLGGALEFWLEQTRGALTAVLDGATPRVLPPLDWSGHTEFRQRVWKAMLRIPPGQTATYGEIAAELGQRAAVRAVGGACGANPVPVLVPCHRVLAAGGRIGGFSGGLDWKRRLMAIEGITPKEKAPDKHPALWKSVSPA